MFVTSNISNFIKNENKVITHSPAEKNPLFASPIHRMLWFRKDLTDHLVPTPLLRAGIPSTRNNLLMKTHIKYIYFSLKVKVATKRWQKQ